ncbi:hypothetical protein D3C71_837040 [compost metagenome]
MAVRVVDFLEMVNVEHQQQCCLSRAGDAIDFAFQHGAEVPAVGQTGERVFEGEFTQSVDQALQVARGHLAVQRCFAAASLSHQRVGSIQAKVAQIYQMRGRRVRHKWSKKSLCSVPVRQREGPPPQV